MTSMLGIVVFSLLLFKPTQSHSNADGLSRLPLNGQPIPSTLNAANIFNMLKSSHFSININENKMGLYSENNQLFCQ